jgi:2-dehydro-3-deoxyphosphooctonate aldolase (KDO 8-P synthase)
MNIQIADYSVGDNQPLLLIAGPCVIESEELCREVAGALCGYSRERNINFVFKPASIRQTAPRFTRIVGQGWKTACVF